MRSGGSELSPSEFYYDGEGRRVNLWSLVPSEAFFEDARGACLRLLKPVLEYGLEQRRDQAIGAGRYGREADRRDYRNGYYVRKFFETAIGVVEGLRVPRCRRQGLAEELRVQMVRARGAVERQVVAMYLRGVSTRNVGELLDGLVGVSVSAGRVSALTRQLDAQVSSWHRRRLEDCYAYLFLDGVWLNSRNVPSLLRRMPEARKRVALVAYGVTHKGQKELIAFRLEKAESEAAWGRFLTDLARRGLSGETLCLVCTDGSTGLLSALDLVYPHVPRQRCWFHKLSNVLGKVRRTHQKECLGGLRAVYTAESRPAAERAYAAWAKRWAEEEPKAVQCVERDLDALLTFFAFPREHWRMLRTTNAIERRFREVRRRTRSVGCFMNNASIERMLYGLFRYHNQRWAGKVCREFREAACTVA